MKKIGKRGSIVVGLCFFLYWLGIPLATPEAYADVQATYYASPAGAGTVCSAVSPCSLAGVQAKVRSENAAMTGDIFVNLLAGTYPLTATWQLTGLDSGTNGYRVVYQAMSGQIPVLSGGTTIAGWTLYDSGKQIYRAYAGVSLHTRQLYVDGKRAVRARGELAPAGFNKTAAGFAMPSTGVYASMDTWANKSAIEMVALNAWRNIRCPVSTITGGTVALQNNCWNNSQLYGIFNTVSWVENAYELLDSPGEWYMDRSAGYVYYIPRSGENMATAEVVAPTVETLVSAAGTLNGPVRNVEFRGLTFAYSTWLQPDTSEGYVSHQAGFSLSGVNATIGLKTPSAVEFHAAENIRLERNTFIHLGGAGLNFDYGSRHNVIIGNVFRDISSSGIQIGDVSAEASNPADSRERVTHNTIQSNYVTDVAAEYYDAVGIFGGYTSYSTISHNEVANLPYTGISLGWGWGTNSYAEHNEIMYNRIHHVMGMLNDGGGIYTLSAQPESTISWNYISDISRSQAHGIYPDEASAYFDITDNVVERITNNWLNMWTNTIHDNNAQYNYADTASLMNACTNCTVDNNTTVTNGKWPTMARLIMDSAGIEQAYRDFIPTNVALYKTANASSVYGAGFGPDKANDGNNATGWSPIGGDPSSWWQVDLGKEKTITQIDLVSRQDLDQPTTRQNFEIRASNDPTFATYTVMGGQGNTPFPNQSTWTAYNNSAATFRYIRVAKTANEYFWITELRVMGY